MNSRSLVKLILLLGCSLSLPLTLFAQHSHLNAGAVSTNQNAQLIWANGADFAASSGYVKTLEYTNDGRFAGYYQGGITPTALPEPPPTPDLTPPPPRSVPIFNSVSRA